MAAVLRAWHQQKKLAEELACLVLKVVLIHPRTCGARLKVNNKMLPQMKVSQHHQIVVVCRKYTNFPMLTFSDALKHTLEIQEIQISQNRLVSLSFLLQSNLYLGN